MSRKLAFAKISFAFAAALAIAAASAASPISSINGTFTSFNPQGGNVYRVDQGTITSGGGFAGGAIKGLNLDFSTFFSNPGTVGVSDAQGNHGLYLGGPGQDANTLFMFNGPLSLSSTPNGIQFTGHVAIDGIDPAYDLSPFANGGIFTMTFDPTQFSIQAGPEGGLVAFAVGLGGAPINWALNPETGGPNVPTSEVPEPLALISFGGLAIGGVWYAKRKKAAA